MGFGNPTTVTFVAYLLLTVGIGFFAWRYTRNLSDYILGGRSLGSFVTALSAGASDMSGWLLMGLPGAVFAFGLSESWIVVGLVLGAWLNWGVVAGRLRVYTELTDNALTLPDYFTARFEDDSRVLRVISSVLILLFFTMYCASGMVASARLFEGTFGLSYEVALWAGAVATIVYVLVGGFLAVSWTDTIQASLMIMALLLVPFVVVGELGGLESAVDKVLQVNAQATDMFGNMTVVGIASLLGWGLGYMGQPHILARFMAVDSVRSIPRARLIGMTWMILCLVGAVLVGFFGSAYFAEHTGISGPVTENRERVFIQLSQVLFNPWIAGVLLSAILSAVMSTLSCQLLVCSSALTEDLYKPFVRKNASQAELVWVGRAMILVVAVVAILIARDPQSRVLGLVGYAWAGFGAAFGPVVLLSLLWPSMTRYGALAGMVTGAATVIVWSHGEWFGAAPGPLFGLYELVPGFAFSAVAVVVGTYLSPVPSLGMIGAFGSMREQVMAGQEAR
ncbi:MULTISPECIES: sodium/proline symporter PutP [unclassified Haematospirillum]|uniref:sodium/proline symporter PutP n=1 Tax=unclassified Haematospirillum TaxID=2622088 RepID=UPI00143B7531|nr:MULTISPECIES: sodium/proline symporter PutP [unclassified Haematospirillum]NKD55468.1 sodium/proline symporter PutP [Haematospirillum sp. H4890]NKD75608.1 sodium/proline symporter PutP [Haematospirillum sp. H4485]